MAVSDASQKRRGQKTLLRSRANRSGMGGGTRRTFPLAIEEAVFIILGEGEGFSPDDAGVAQW